MSTTNLGTTELVAVYKVYGRLTMEKYRAIIADAKERSLPLPVHIIAKSNGGPQGSPNYNFSYYGPTFF
ncbi:MAG: hypothetical protein M0R06_22350 [Sphaerochaeta sp.]|nr:hypothetical protein [Sphaerochaeta sp.]